MLVTQVGTLKATESAYHNLIPLPLLKFHREFSAVSLANVSTFPFFFLPCLSNLPTFRCFDAQISLKCLYDQLEIFFWIITVKFVEISRGEIKEPPHASVLLTSTLYVSYIDFNSNFDFDLNNFYITINWIPSEDKNSLSDSSTTVLFLHWCSHPMLLNVRWFP